ncbi:MAG: metallophosphatase family protein [Prolixibacteraceae bacterium]|nr:metallophosphatase family protein [Prolixibacteraceae bacterium]
MKLAIISDIHEDVVNLKSALRKIEKMGCDEIVCLGDISGFSVPHYHFYDTRDAHSCLKLVKENCRYIVLGNHDLNAIRKTPEYSSGFDYPDNWHSLDYCERKELSNDKVWLYDHDELNPLYTLDDVEFLTTQKEYLIISHGGKNYFFSHYIYPNLSGSFKSFYHRAAEYAEHFNVLTKHNCELGFAGHTHPNGLYVACNFKTRRIKFRKRFRPDGLTNIEVPSVTGNKFNNGFCIFNISEEWIRAERI